MVYVPMFASSTDPAVVAAVTRNQAERERFDAQARAFLAEHGVHGRHRYLMLPTRRRVSLIGVRGSCPTGWVRMSRGTEAWRPPKGTALREQMEQIAVDFDDVPGIQDSYRRAGIQHGGPLSISPMLFTHDRVAWFRLPEEPREDAAAVFDHGIWTEVLGSDWHRAHDAAHGHPYQD